jgi:hypothetical protein
MRIIVLLTIIILTFNFQALFSQAPDTIWTKTYGGITFDEGSSVQQTSDGGYIVTGCTYSFGAGGGDVWLIKIDSSGDTLWTKTYGGSDNELGNSVQQTTDGGYIITGNMWSLATGTADIWLIKTDASGDTLWTKTFGGSDNDVAYSVQQTNDGGYIITGEANSFVGDGDVLLIKTDALGNALWTKTFGGSDIDWGSSIQQTSDGGYIITGLTRSYGAGDYDTYLIKTNSSGDTIWTKIFGGSYSDEGSSVQQTTDGGYIITGRTDSYGAGNGDVWLIKTDSAGDTLWTRTFGGSDNDYGLSVCQTTDGGYIIAGFTYSFGAGDADVWLIKTDSSGDTLWIKTSGGYEYERGSFVQQTSDGGYVITGLTVSYGAGGADVWLIKLAPETSGITKKESTNLILHYRLSPNYPNPFNPITTIEFDLPKTSEVTLRIFNILGEEVATIVSDRLSTGSYSYEWDASELASGVYLYRLEAEGFVQTRKMILMK